MRYTTPMKPEDIPAVTLPLERCMYCWYVLHHYNRTFEKKSKHPHSQPVEQLSY